MELREDFTPPIATTVVLNNMTANIRQASGEVIRPPGVGPASRQFDHRMTSDSFRKLVEHYPDAILVMRADRVLYANTAAVLLMVAQTSDDLVGRQIAELLAPDGLPALKARAAALKKLGDTSRAVIAEMRCLDGTTVPVELVSVLTQWGHEPAHQVIVRVIGERKVSYRKDFAKVADLLDEGVIVMRRDGVLKFMNRAAMRICDVASEHDAAHFIKRAVTSRFYSADGTLMPPEMHPAALSFRTNVSFSREIFGMDVSTGKRRWVLATGRLLDPDDPDSDVLVSISDITAQREDLDRLIYQANHDPLTGLPNRAFALRRIGEALHSTGSDRLRAVLFIDLDDLKTTNDTFGHHAGDELLIAAATRLRDSVNPTDVVGRHGGDEFVVLIFGDSTRDELNDLMRRLLVRFAEPVPIAEALVPIRASVGFVEVEADERRTAEDILRDADRAMYRAKRAHHRLDR